jgi:hypothetical protein
MLKALFKVFLILIPLTAAAQSKVDDPRVFELFQKRVYPFLVNNCAKCHSEKAIYPRGPSHTHSNPTIAFATFMKFVEFDEPQKSLVVRQAKNQHFCKEHDYNCNRADQITDEAMGVLENFIGLANSLRPMGTPGPDSRVSQAKSDASGGRVLEFAPVQFDDQDQFTAILKATTTNLVLSLTLERYSGELFTLSNIGVIGDNAIISISGVDILINGQLSNSQTGLENLQRKLIFPDHNNTYQKLAIERPTFSLKRGDTVSVRIRRFAILKDFGGKLCVGDGLDRFKSIFLPVIFALPISDEQVHNLEETLGLRKKNLLNQYGPSGLAVCLAFESRINIRNPRRSVLPYDLPGEGFIFEILPVGEIMKFIYTWLAAQ